MLDIDFAQELGHSKGQIQYKLSSYNLVLFHLFPNKHKKSEHTCIYVYWQLSIYKCPCSWPGIHD